MAAASEARAYRRSSSVPHAQAAAEQAVPPFFQAAARAEDAEELVEPLHELEAGMARGAPARPPRSLRGRDPLLFWRVVSAVLPALLLAALAALRAS